MDVNGINKLLSRPGILSCSLLAKLLKELGQKMAQPAADVAKG